MIYFLYDPVRTATHCPHAVLKQWKSAINQDQHASIDYMR